MTNRVIDGMKCRDLVKQRVITVREIHLRSGVVIPVGTIAIVSSVWRGKLTLRGEKKMPNGCIDLIARQIPREAVNLATEVFE